MRWMTHGQITPAAIEAIRRHGHTVQSAEELIKEDAIEAADLLNLATTRQLDVITTDKDLVQFAAGVKASRFPRAIAYLRLLGGEVEQDDAIDRLFARYKSPKPGMLYTVTETRVKVRQLPGL